ncbi:hypothetical protein [Bradyrhizobium lablabi]|uniref:hypothetical protein n=1 Tax=Bradyrhizobium lablabi TaxID=722472 RepID=UPI0012ABD859|nr:hypothetical protein [Bradyrhizobium lablabi]
MAAGFNRGRCQVNLNFLQTGGDFPFINCLKTAQAWGLCDNSGAPDPDTLDSDGYPKTIVHGGVYTVFFVPSQAVRPGNYVITWAGNGTIVCGMSNSPVSGSKTSVNGTGRYVFSTTDARFSVGITSIGNPRISNLRVFHADDEAALNAGQIFGLKFKQRLIEANFGVIRFLNWQNGNTTNVTTWASRKPISYVYYSGTEFRGSLYAGLTTNVGSAYSASLAGFALTDKAMVLVKFNASTTSSCTLNVNGTGNIPVLNAYSNPLSAGGNSYPVGGGWQSIAALVYDATLNAWIKQGGDNALGSVGISNGCPPEIMVQLCAEIGAHPYFVAPPLSVDPATDYIPSLASYCRANAPAWMIPRFEGPNELWNNGGGFYQTSYAVSKATAYGWGADYDNWYGKVMSVIGQAVSAAYGGDRTKYQVLCGVQSGIGLSANGPSSCNARLASSKYLAQPGPAQTPYTKSAAANWVTHVCCAQYYSPSRYSTTQETSDASAFAAAVGNPALQLSIATAYANTANSGSGIFTLAQCAIMYSNWKAWAKSFNVTSMCGYEGGYSPDYTGDPQLDALRSASKLAASLSNFTTINFNNFVTLSGNGFTAEFPSVFQLSGMAPSNNVWSILEDVYQRVSPPQWNAIVAFNH